MNGKLTRSIDGLTDALARLYVNLYGAPALSMKDYANYKQDMIIGVSLAIGPPTGQYNTDKLVNLGTNRWFIKPEIGISKAFGALTTEFAGGMYYFTNNNQPLSWRHLRTKAHLQPARAFDL